MCSVDSCVDLKVERKLNLTGAPCRKCEEKKAQIVLQGKFPYCKECFLIYFQHKYSGGIGKAKVLKTGDSVLIAFSASASSACLLHLVHSSLIEDRKKKTRFLVTVIFIDEGCYNSKEERDTTLKSIGELVSGYGYKLLYSSLTPLGESVYLTEDPSTLLSINHDRLHSILSEATNTARADIIERLRLHVLNEAAKKINCNKIFTGETSDHIATKILVNVAVGRGNQLPSDTGFSTNLDGGILLVRPLRDCSRKEVAFYNIYYRLRTLHFTNLLEEDKFSSIQKLTEGFVLELQESFPSTVPTVLSTGSKLRVGEAVGHKHCFLCQSSLETEAERELSAEEAMRISQVLTSAGPAGFDSQHFTAGSRDEDGNSLSKERSSACYACNTIINECKMTDEVLNTLVPKRQQKVQRQTMYDQIKDFML